VWQIERIPPDEVLTQNLVNPGAFMTTSRGLVSTHCRFRRSVLVGTATVKLVAIFNNRHRCSVCCSRQRPMPVDFTKSLTPAGTKLNQLVPLNITRNPAGELH
jgi:hypothetical protein